MKTRIICFGNEVMGDDGVGIHVAAKLRERIEAKELSADLIESSVAGYALMELLEGWDRVILVEAVKLKEHSAGEILRLDPKSQKTTLRLCSMREGNLPLIMSAGAKLGHAMPEDVVVLGIQGEDLCTFSDQLSAAVAEAVPKVVEAVIAEVER